MVFSQYIYNALSRNKVILTTSLDTGIASTYKRLRGSDTYQNVVKNLRNQLCHKNKDNIFCGPKKQISFLK